MLTTSFASANQALTSARTASQPSVNPQEKKKKNRECAINGPSGMKVTSFSIAKYLLEPVIRNIPSSAIRTEAEEPKKVCKYEEATLNWGGPAKIVKYQEATLHWGLAAKIEKTATATPTSTAFGARKFVRKTPLPEWF